VREAVKRHSAYIGSQTLATAINLTLTFPEQGVREVEIDEVGVKLAVIKNS
jgi:hypothetical protein